MRIRKKRWAKPEIEQDPKVIFNKEQYKGIWHEVFGNNNPIHLELGCGKGQFITKLAQLNPDINYIAIDFYPELLVYVLRKTNENNLTNIRIVPMLIEEIEEVFAPNEVEKIYINFCTPWPKKRHNKRRLTYPTFLRKYKSFLKKGSEVWFKTDDEELFTDSLEYFQTEGFQEIYKTFDLHHSNFKDNIMTEYEEKFTLQGIKTKFAIFRY